MDMITCDAWPKGTELSASLETLGLCVCVCVCLLVCSFAPLFVLACPGTCCLSGSCESRIVAVTWAGVRWKRWLVSCASDIEDASCVSLMVTKTGMLWSCDVCKPTEQALPSAGHRRLFGEGLACKLRQLPGSLSRSAEGFARIDQGASLLCRMYGVVRFTKVHGAAHLSGVGGGCGGGGGRGGGGGGGCGGGGVGLRHQIDESFKPGRVFTTFDFMLVAGEYGVPGLRRTSRLIASTGVHTRGTPHKRYMILSYPALYCCLRFHRVSSTHSYSSVSVYGMLPILHHPLGEDVETFNLRQSSM